MLPPDRGHVATELRHPASGALDALGTRDVVLLMADDHRQVVAAVESAADSIAAFVDALVPRLRAGGRLIYVGAGTSGRLGVLDAAECPPTFHSAPDRIVGIIAGGDAALRKSSEGLEDDPRGAAAALGALALGDTDTVLGIAAGGTTPYVLGALEDARRLGAATGLLTCAAPRFEGPPCDHVIRLETGPELLTGSTRLKAGSATKLVLNIITTTAFTRLGKVYGNLMIDLRATNDKLRDRALRILTELCPHLTREAAHDLLARAGSRLKTAIVMEKRGVAAAEAQALLRDHDEDLRAVIED